MTSPSEESVQHSLIRLVFSDLERQYDLTSQRGKKATLFAVLLRTIHPRFMPLLLCRLSRATFLLGLPILPFAFSYINLLLYGLQVTPRCEIGKGLFLPHTSGTVLGAWRIGSDVTIFQGVTLGAKTIDLSFDRSLLPSIGNRVTIGAGAKVLGGIYVGDGATIGANAVVLNGVDPDSTVVGIPARKVARDIGL